MIVDRKAWRSTLLALAAYCAFHLGLPLIHVPLHGLTRGTAALLVLLPTCVFMLLQLWLSRALVGLRPKPVVSLGLTLLAVALVLATYHVLRSHHPLGMLLLLYLMLNLWITGACTFFGILLSRIVREANILLPVALVAMPIDYIGAMTPVGFTQNMVARHGNIVQAVSVHVPAVGGVQPISYIGPGDALFMAFFFAVVLRLGLNERGTFWWMYALLTLAMLLVLTLPNFAVAALVPMGLAVVIANARSFRLQRSEVFAACYAALFVLGLVVAFYFYSHSHFFRH